MANSPAIDSLKRVRTDISAQIQDMQVRIEVLKADLIHIDASLQLLGVKNPQASCKVKRMSLSGIFGKNELPRMLYAELRKSENGLTTRDLARRVIKGRGWDIFDKRLEDSLTNRIGNTLDRLRSRGAVASNPVGKSHLWWMVG